MWLNLEAINEGTTEFYNYLSHLILYYIVNIASWVIIVIIHDLYILTKSSTSCFLGTFWAVDFLAVCLVLAMRI